MLAEVNTLHFPINLNKLLHTPEGAGAYFQGMLHGRADLVFGRFDVASYRSTLYQISEDLGTDKWFHASALDMLQMQGYQAADPLG